MTGRATRNKLPGKYLESFALFVFPSRRVVWRRNEEEKIFRVEKSRGNAINRNLSQTAQKSQCLESA